MPQQSGRVSLSPGPGRTVACRCPAKSVEHRAARHVSSWALIGHRSPRRRCPLIGGKGTSRFGHQGPEMLEADILASTSIGIVTFRTLGGHCGTSERCHEPTWVASSIALVDGGEQWVAMVKPSVKGGKKANSKLACATNFLVDANETRVSVKADALPKRKTSRLHESHR